jgi:hypothetical protein
MSELLTSNERWQDMSNRARKNSERFKWEGVSAPLIELFDELVKGKSGA